MSTPPSAPASDSQPLLSGPAQGKNNQRRSMQLERPQLLGTDVRGIVERCRMCRGELAKAGEEVACTTCGVVARREERLYLEVQVRAPSQTGNRRLGSYIGTNSDKNSDADFGSSTVGLAKRLSDHM